MPVVRACLIQWKFSRLQVSITAAAAQDIELAIAKIRGRSR